MTLVPPCYFFIRLMITVFIRYQHSGASYWKPLYVIALAKSKFLLYNITVNKWNTPYFQKFYKANGTNLV